jgi:hypothetical protein
VIHEILTAGKNTNNKENTKMKKLLSVLAIGGIMSATAAMAAPFMPTPGPLYIKFDNKEQLSTQNFTQYGENNWGILEVSSISTGNIAPPNNTQNFPPLNQIWSQLSSTGEITGMFGGISASSSNGVLNSTGGSVYLYWDDTPDADLGTANLSDRTGQFSFNNFTDGVFLAKIDFLNGAITASDPNASITGNAVPTAGGFTGIANSFGVVDLAAGGAWASILNSNYFDTLLGQNTADLKFRNIYENSGAHDWDDFSGRLPIFGADSSDPARANVVPEPSTILLLGAGLLGLAGFRRKNRK